MPESSSHPAIGQYRNDSYADALFEKNLESVQFGRITKQQVGGVQELVQEIGRGIGSVIPPEIVAPDRGCLKEEISRDDRAFLNAHLGPKYAHQTALQQEGMNDIGIEERGDRMVNLLAKFQEYKACYQTSERKFEDVCGSYASQPRIHWVRVGVADKMASACKALNGVNLQMYLYDCFRPEQVQAPLFIRRAIKIAQDEKLWSEKKVAESTRSLTAFSPGSAGHQAGAAVDWRLKRTGNGNSWKPTIGNEYPEGGAVSSIDFPYVTFDQWKTRVLFSATMSMAGMRLLRTEDWHASFGDRGMGLDGEKHEALYGPIKEFDHKTGEILDYYHPSEVDEPYVSDQEIEEIVGIARSVDTITAGFKQSMCHLFTNRSSIAQDRIRRWVPEAMSSEVFS